MRKEWKSVDDCIAFLLADHKDDITIKMALVKQIAKVTHPSCIKCSLTKGGPPVFFLI
jgi:hypothetical protein